MNFRDYIVYGLLAIALLSFCGHNIFCFIKKIFLKYRAKMIDKKNESIKSTDKHISKSIDFKLSSRIKQINFKKVVNKLIKYFFGNSYSKNNKRLFVALCVTTFITVVFAPNRIPKSKPMLSFMYSFLVISAIFYLIKCQIDSIYIEKDKVSQCINIGLALVYIVYIFSINIGPILSGKYNFYSVVFSFVFDFTITIYFIFKFTTHSSKKIVNTIFGIAVIIAMECYLLALYGMYNTTNSGDFIVNKNSTLKLAVSYIYYGAYYAFNIKQPAKDAALYPFFEYLSITFYNIIVIGFFMAYFYDLIKGKDNSIKKKSSNTKIELVKFE